MIVFALIMIWYMDGVKSNHVEEFSPYVSTLVHDIRRSDPSYDVPRFPDNVPGRTNETYLFNQLVGWVANTP
jgi:hypothetical protein